MSQKQVTVCDVCGKIKAEANNWIAVIRTPSKISGVLYPSLFLAPREQMSEFSVSDVCSDQCHQKLVAEVVEEIRSYKP